MKIFINLLTRYVQMTQRLFKKARYIPPLFVDSGSADDQLQRDPKHYILTTILRQLHKQSLIKSDSRRLTEVKLSNTNIKE